MEQGPYPLRLCLPQQWQAVAVTGPNGAAPEGAPRRQFDDWGGGGGYSGG